MKTGAAHVLSLFLLICSWPLQAGVQLDGTRVIYPAGKREVTLGLTNHSSAPRLLQAWIDAGDDNLAHIPFVIMPPLFRLDPDKGQSLRIVYTGGALPQDRESVFWINVLEVQPKRIATQAEANAISVSIRTRLKLFYRPAGLPGSPQNAVSQLRWRLVSDSKGYAIECDNPGAYNVSFNHVGLQSVSTKESDKQSGMCPAKGKKIFNVMQLPKIPGDKLTLTVIDDFGGYHERAVGFNR